MCELRLKLFELLHLRFPASDGAENEMKLGGKGGKGKRRQKNNSLSSSMEVVKEGECQDDALTFSILVACKKNGIMMIRNHSSIFSVSKRYTTHCC